jgi:hypothetical protein
MLRSFQPLAFSKTRKITQTILTVLSRDFLMYWGMQASENLFGFESSHPKKTERKLSLALRFVFFLSTQGTNIISRFSPKIFPTFSQPFELAFLTFLW